MLRTILLSLLTLPLFSFGQETKAEPSYGSVALEQLPKELKKHADALIIDVRTPAEFIDQALPEGLNMGHVQGAVNLPMDELASRLTHMVAKKQIHLYVYSAQAIRSRQACDQLVALGYTNVMHVDRGLQAFWTGTAQKERSTLLKIKLPYTLISMSELCEHLVKGDATIVDLRGSTMASLSERAKAAGAPVGAIQTSIQELQDVVDQLPKDKPVVLLDDDGSQAAQGALALQRFGYSDLRVLFGGTDAMLQLPKTDRTCNEGLWSSIAPYTTMSVYDLDSAELRMGPLLIIDIRSSDEYNGTTTDETIRLGRIKGSFHMAAINLVKDMPSMELFPHDPILLMGRGKDEEVYRLARSLTKMGFSDVRVLAGGLAHLHWAIDNVPGMAHWSDHLEFPESGE